MTASSYAQILIYFLVVLALTKPIGAFMAAVLEGRRTFLHPLLRPLEAGCYRLLGVREDENMPWQRYASAMLLFSAFSLFVTYVLLRLQGWLPFNPEGFGVTEMTPDLAFNTAVSFTTNTNWQSYSPELTLSYFSNMTALAIHNWMSSAVGLAIAIAVIRGFTTELSSGIGNFWVDVTRATLYVLLPLCLVGALVFVSIGVPQNFMPYQQVTTLEGATQTIAQGPVASQEIIKQLGTNGGGFFNANSAHPYENPTPFSNFFSMVLIFLIPSGLTYTFGRMLGNQRQGWSLFLAMSVLFLAGVFICNYAEQQGTPHLAAAGVSLEGSSRAAGGNMEGKETRFGITASTLFAAITTGASCGAVNSMHDSYTPLGGLVPLFNILSGEVIFGGVGAGLYGMLMFAVLSVFIAGLMIGRTPEYLGKKIRRFEVQACTLAVLVLAASILAFSGIALNADFAAESAWNRVGTSDVFLGATTNNLNNAGAHGFSEVLYAFASATGNNGSAFAGITANTPFYNLTLGVAMLIGRFFMILPLLAMAGNLARAGRVPVSAGTFPTDNPTFVVLLVSVVLIVGALTFFPALALGPIVEHFQLSDLALR